MADVFGAVYDVDSEIEVGREKIEEWRVEICVGPGSVPS